MGIRDKQFTLLNDCVVWRGRFGKVNLTEFVIWGCGDKQFTLLNDCVVWGGRFRKVYLNKCVVWGCRVLLYVLCGKAGMGKFA